MIFEVCANSIHSAINAEKGGAHRIELCSGLEIGGITPSYGLILEAKKQLDIPIHVLIRPRSGHFFYSNTEINIIKKDILFCRENGIDGVVIGLLTKSGKVDVVVLNELVELARPMKVAFHRAFDRAKDPIAAFDKLMDAEVDILLTSGQQPKAVDGIELLNKLVKFSNGKIEVMPGSGVNKDNALEIVKRTGAGAIHFSGKEVVGNDDVFLKEGFEESGKYWVSGVDVVREVVGLF